MDQTTAQGVRKYSGEISLDRARGKRGDRGFTEEGSVYFGAQKYTVANGLQIKAVRAMGNREIAAPRQSFGSYQQQVAGEFLCGERQDANRFAIIASDPRRSEKQIGEVLRGGADSCTPMRVTIGKAVELQSQTGAVSAVADKSKGIALEIGVFFG